MGGKQTREPMLPQSEVNRLLNAEREIYEKKEKKWLATLKRLKNAYAAINAAIPTPQPAAVSSSALPVAATNTPKLQPAATKTPPLQPAATNTPTLQPTATSTPHRQQTANFAQKPTQTAGLERHARDDLQNINRQNTPPTSYLCPKLRPLMDDKLNAHRSHCNSRYPEPVQDHLPASQTRQTESSINTFKITELLCVTCKAMLRPPIYKCRSAHSSCNTCKEYRRPCGECGNDITNMRNIVLEQRTPLQAYIPERKEPCPHSDDGCKLLIKMSDIEFHVKECPFKELQCPLGCSWKGKLWHLCGHFDSTHPTHRTADVGTESRLQNICNYSRHTFLILIRSFNFLFHIKVQNRKIYMAVQLIGTTMSASKWSYGIHVYDKNENSRMYTFTDVCTSNVQPVANIFNEGSCVILPSVYANTFIDNGGINYKFFINQIEETRLPRDVWCNQKYQPRHKYD